MLAALVIAIASTPSDAAPNHGGFFLRLDLGFGYFSSSSGSFAASGQSETYTGAAGGLGVSIGGNVGNNVALYGELFDAVVSNPQINGNGSSNSSAGIGGLGIGVAWYLMPANVFFTGTLGVGRLIVTTNGIDNPSQAGLVGRLGFGKEWMVSRSWGLGIAGYLNFGFNAADSNGGPTFTTLSPLVAFSATFY